jgi:2-polyprenyl-3-methyl-5-hydroxy-6-metoxy-1,4-benzoquinol methylase
MRGWRLATASDPQLAGRPSYRLDRCEACGTAVTVDADDPPGALYEGGTYAAERPAFAPLLAPLRRLAERDRLRFLSSLPAGARVLEVGAGDGRFVALLAAAGFRAHGIEPSPSACEAAARIGAKVANARAETAALEPGAEDAVVIWHALEHTEDPHAVVGRAREWLVAGGRLIVAVPDLASLQARIGGDRWFHQDVPRHRTHFTRDGLVRLLERNGLAVTRVRHLLVEQNPLGMWQTLLNRLTGERDFAFRLIKRDLGDVGGGAMARDLLTTAVAGPLLVPVALALELGAGVAGRGGSMVVEAIR